MDLNNSDDATDFLAEHFPKLWRKFYNELLAQGFKEAEALELLKVYIWSQGSGDKKL